MKTNRKLLAACFLGPLDWLASVSIMKWRRRELAHDDPSIAN